jgi:hypothetical protein
VSIAKLEILEICACLGIAVLGNEQECDFKPLREMSSVKCRLNTTCVNPSFKTVKNFFTETRMFGIITFGA